MYGVLRIFLVYVIVIFYAKYFVIFLNYPYIVVVE